MTAPTKLQALGKCRVCDSDPKEPWPDAADDWVVECSFCAVEVHAANPQSACTAWGYADATPPIAAPEDEIKRLHAVIERDRSTVAIALSAITNAIAGSSHLRVGRGNYKWNDDRWMEEFGAAVDRIAKAAEPLRKVAGDMSDSPRTQAEVMAARAEPVALADAEREELVRWVDGRIGACVNGASCLNFASQEREQFKIDERFYRRIAAVLRTPAPEPQPAGEVLEMPLSDVNDLDDVAQSADTTPADAVRELKAEIERLHAADRIVREVEERFPNWRGFRDLIDCIVVTLHELGHPHQ